MSELLTYAAMAERLKCSPEAARALAKRLRLPRQLGNDGKALVLVDLAEMNHKPMPTRSPSGYRAMDLKATLEALRADLAELEDENASLRAAAAGHRTDYERERDRADTLMAQLLKSTADLMAARETAAKLDGELAALRRRPWWKRLVG
jgi:hypothetical protein